EPERADAAEDEVAGERHDLVRDATARRQPVDELVVPDQDHLAARRRRDDPLAHEGAPEALHEVEVRSDLVGAVDRERELVVVERAERDAEAPRLGSRRLGGRNAHDTEAAPYALGEAGDQPGRAPPRPRTRAPPVPH